MFAGGNSEARARAAVDAGPSAVSGSAPETGTWADVVALTVPFAAIAGAVEAIGPLEGKILWSCANALRPDMSDLEVGFDTSAAEQVALHPLARTVAAIPPFAEVLRAPTRLFASLAPTVFCCGGDRKAKEVVAAPLRDLGADPVDAGPLTAARWVEPAMMLLIRLAYGGPIPRAVALKLLER